MNGRGDRPFFSIRPCSNLAIWSAPPPVPAMMMNSTGFFGDQSAWAPVAKTPSEINATSAEMPSFLVLLMNTLIELLLRDPDCDFDNHRSSSSFFWLLVEPFSAESMEFYYLVYNIPDPTLQHLNRGCKVFSRREPHPGSGIRCPANISTTRLTAAEFCLAKQASRLQSVTIFRLRPTLIYPCPTDCG